MRSFPTSSILYRYFSSSSSSSIKNLPNLLKIRARFRPKAVEEAQNVLTDYLHTTRHLSYTFAEQISNNSLFSLSEIMAKVEFSHYEYSQTLQMFLRYNPINEFKFFYESIGIHFDQVNGLLPSGKFFLSDDLHVYDVACALWGFGFPWNKLGVLYREERSIFDGDVSVVKERLDGFKQRYGFDNMMVIGTCLNFPFVLSGNKDLGGEIDGLLGDLKRVFLDYGLVGFVEGNVDSWVEVCRKIRVFYDLGCAKGEMGDLMGRSKNVFVEHSEEILVRKIEYFCKLDVSKVEIGHLFLSKPEILRFDFESPYISIFGFLQYYGLEEEKLKFIADNYSYVMGRNKMSNLPNVLRSLGLNEWFFDKMRNGDHNLLANYSICCPEEDLDSVYTNFIVTMSAHSFPHHTRKKLNFLHGIGFGENKLTINILKHMRGSSSDLQERFDCLLHNGVKFSNLCKMIYSSPHILNQEKDQIDQKVKYLCKDIGFSLQYLDMFPSYLCYNLEKRIRPRFRFHMWLTENGLCKREFSLPSILATSERNFIRRVYRMHPAAPKRWLESFFKKEFSSM